MSKYIGLNYNNPKKCDIYLDYPKNRYCKNYKYKKHDICKKHFDEQENRKKEIESE